MSVPPYEEPKTQKKSLHSISLDVGLGSKTADMTEKQGLSGL